MRRGFTLIEMMVALLVSAVTVVVAAKIAETVLRNNATSRSRSDLATLGRVLAGQIRADLRVAGLGSTGLIAVDNAGPLSPGAFAVPPTGYIAVPAVRVIDNVPAGTVVGAMNVAPGSDLIQVVVPNPITVRTIAAEIPVGGSLMVLEPGLPSPFVPGPDCPGVYVVDQSGATQGRTQYLFLGNNDTLSGTLQFPIPPGAQVMCGRITTYWLEAANGAQPPWLHRSVATGGGVLQQVNGAPVGPPVLVGTGQDERIAPGVMDLQVAIALSAEVFPGGLGPNTANGRWALTPLGGAAIGAMEHWAEVRVVRINLLTRTTRANSQQQITRLVGPRENGAAPVLPPNRNLSFEWITISENLTNLRYFDGGADSGVPASPF